MNQRSKSMAILLGLGAILIIVSVLAVAIGSVHIPAGEVVAIILRRLHQLVTWQATNLELGNDVIVLNLRLPRAILAACVGACLALAGCMMQGLLRNPMADPYVIGVSAGASVGGAIAFLLTGALGWRFGMALTPLLAFLGAILAVVLVYLIARVDGRIPIMSLLLSGIALNTVLSAVLSFLIYFSTKELQSLIYWLMGSFNGRGWLHVGIILPHLAIGLVLAVYLARDLNALSLGEEAAATLGVHVEGSKRLLLLASTLLTAGAVSVSGIIGFVGLLVPHISRLLFGPDHRLLLPASALLGSIFLVIADLLSRIIVANAQLPVGIITSICGGPFFLYLLRRNQARRF